MPKGSSFAKRLFSGQARFHGKRFHDLSKAERLTVIEEAISKGNLDAKTLEDVMPRRF